MSLQKLGISQLNEMQKAVTASAASTMILLSPTGSGKTVAFALKMLKGLHPANYVQALLIAPSRELVLQIAEVVRTLGKGLKVTPLYGGRSMRDETPTLTPPPDVVIATPGRLLDHINRKDIDIAGVKRLVLDEYDKCLALGFLDDMRRIVKRIKHPRLTILTSATPLAEYPDFLNLSGAETLDFTEQATSAPRERMEILKVTSPDADKLPTLLELLSSFTNRRVMIFTNHRESAERVYDYLRSHHIPATLYHGGLDQQQREIALATFENGTAPVMVCTDLAARGLDIAGGVDAVVHYHIPVDEQAWTHRNGRTARVDARGEVYVIVSAKDTLPEWIEFDGDYTPDAAGKGISSSTSTLYFNLGKKNKVSKGDILGFLGKEGGLPGDKIGRIIVRDRYSLAAVATADVKHILALPQPRLKGQRVRITSIAD